MKETMDSLQRQIDAAAVESRVWEPVSYTHLDVYKRQDYECYICEMDLDEDELVRFLSDTHYDCPYYRNGDEYLVVRKQI